MIRTFVALFPPPDVVDAAARFMAPLQRGGGGVKWVSPELLHYTLRFFGDQPEEAVRRILSTTETVASLLAPFSARLAGTGTFPPRGRPRVYWLGMDRGAGAFTALATTLDRAYEAAGLGAADRPAAPHLTIGRVRRGGRPEPATGPLAGFGRLTFSGPDFIFSNVRVVQSDLTPRGPTYTPLGEYPLSGSG